MALFPYDENQIDIQIHELIFYAWNFAIPLGQI